MQTKTTKYETTAQTKSGCFITRALSEGAVSRLIATMQIRGLIAIKSSCGLESGKFNWDLAKVHEELEQS